MLGGAGADQIYSGGGNDILTGGPGADMFQFFVDGGADQITDFRVGFDEISVWVLRGSAWAAPGAIQAATSLVGGSAVIDFGGGNSITLVGVNPALLTGESIGIVEVDSI